MIEFLMIAVALCVVFGPFAAIAEIIIDAVFKYFNIYERMGY